MEISNRLQFMPDWVNNMFVEAFCELLNEHKIMIIETKDSRDIVEIGNNADSPTSRS